MNTMTVNALIVLALAVSGQAVRFTIRNNEQGPVWIGIQGNSGHEALANGGFQLDTYQERTVDASKGWAGRFWARTWCYSDTNHCDTGDCGNRLECRGAGGVPPATLVEIKLGGWAGQDFYDISLVDGFNVKASIEPIGGNGNCRKASCNHYINDDCPSELRVHGAHAGYTVACKNAGYAAKFYKDRCPDAYSYDYDDATSTFTCASDNYYIVFG